jgi:hypothetical protein
MHDNPGRHYHFTHPLLLIKPALLTPEKPKQFPVLTDLFLECSWSFVSRGASREDSSFEISVVDLNAIYLNNWPRLNRWNRGELGE